jgi:hypothetical protein
LLSEIELRIVGEWTSTYVERGEERERDIGIADLDKVKSEKYFSSVFQNSAALNTA